MASDTTRSELQEKKSYPRVRFIEVQRTSYFSVRDLFLLAHAFGGYRRKNIEKAIWKFEQHEVAKLTKAYKSEGGYCSLDTDFLQLAFGDMFVTWPVGLRVSYEGQEIITNSKLREFNAQFDYFATDRKLVDANYVAKHFLEIKMDYIESANT
jgi:hypothetical protein